MRSFFTQSKTAQRADLMDDYILVIIKSNYIVRMNLPPGAAFYYCKYSARSRPVRNIYQLIMVHINILARIILFGYFKYYGPGLQRHPRSDARETSQSLRCEILAQISGL